MAAAESSAYPSDDDWVAAWRRAVLEHAWSAMEEFERTHSGNLSHTVLRMRADHPEEDSDALATRLSEATRRRFRADAVRQQLRRARLRFAQLVVEEIAGSMDDPTPERVEEELLAVGLMEYVRDFLPPDWRTRGELHELLQRG